MLAQADSPGSVYETHIPSAEGETKPTKPNPLNNPGTGEKDQEGDATKSTSPPSGESPEPDEQAEEGTEGSQGVPAGKGDGGGDNGNPSTAKGGGGAQAKEGNGSSVSLSDRKAIETPKVSNPSPVSDGGGSSSPLVPILIAIAALAAISIGAYVIRQRRQGPGQASPKAS